MVSGAKRLLLHDSGSRLCDYSFADNRTDSPTHSTAHSTAHSGDPTRACAPEAHGGTRTC